MMKNKTIHCDLIQDGKSQSVTFHVSCSKKLETGDRFGSLILVYLLV
uniref:DUF7467 domain-containing protein n=1 Tax=viral metagenome TaxID=1070528 RepID=A0A6C0JA78_9ZZZZ